MSLHQRQFSKCEKKFHRQSDILCYKSYANPGRNKMQHNYGQRLLSKWWIKCQKNCKWNPPRRLQNLQRFGGDKHRRGQFTKIRPKVRVIFNRSSRYFKTSSSGLLPFCFIIQEYRQVFLENCFGKYFILLELCVESTDILNRQTI